MKQQPHISIVTVVRNGEKYLEQTIQSVISQSYKNWEYIVIDGASTDGTLEIIKKYERHLSYWMSEPDKGVYDAMNKGIQKCSGKYIALLNSSDWYQKDALKSIAQMIVKKPQTDIFFGDIYIYDELREKKHLLRALPSSFFIFWLEMRIFHSTMFVKNNVYKKLKYDPSYRIISDIKFVLTAMKKGYTFEKNPFPVSIYRLGGISSSGYKTLVEEIRMKTELQSSKLFVYLSTLTRAATMAAKVVSAKLNISV